MKKTLIVILAALLLLSLTGCGYSLTGGQPDGKITSNNGIAVQQGDFIYYINGSMPTLLSEAIAQTPQATIFRMNADGTEKQQLSTRKAYSFYIVGEYIYFLSPTTADRLCIFRVSINGGNERRILEFENSGAYAFSDTGIAVELNNSLLVYSIETEKVSKHADVGNIYQIYGGDKKLYYYISNKAGIMETDYNGAEPVAVTERNGRIMGVDDDFIYYIYNDEKLTRRNLASGEENTLSSSTYETMLLSLENNTMIAYSSEKDTLYYMRLDGSTRVAILEGEVNTYGMSSDRIFYCSKSEGVLYSVDFEGKNKETLADISAMAGPGSTDPNYYLDVVDDKLFLFDAANQAAVYMIHLTTGEVTNIAS